MISSLYLFILNCLYYKKMKDSVFSYLFLEVFDFEGVCIDKSRIGFKKMEEVPVFLVKIYSNDFLDMDKKDILKMFLKVNNNFREYDKSFVFSPINMDLDEGVILVGVGVRKEKSSVSFLRLYYRLLK